MIGVRAQRLVRRICPDCRQRYQPSGHELRELGLLDTMKGEVFVGSGCDKCFRTGYRGRTGIYELMLINEEIKELIYKRGNAGQIKKAAIESGLKTLRMDGARKVLEGMTTISEVLRVSQADVM